MDSLLENISRFSIQSLIGVVTADFTAENILAAASILVAEGVSLGREMAAQDDMSDVIGAQYIALLDERVCAWCEALDGTEFDYPSAELETYAPAQHWRCRCILGYIMRGEVGFSPTENIDEVSISRFEKAAGRTDLTPGEIALRYAGNNDDLNRKHTGATYKQWEGQRDAAYNRADKGVRAFYMEFLSKTKKGNN